jgi:hypothetical protein
MTHTISPDRKTLVIEFSPSERDMLTGLGDLIHQDSTMCDCLEGLTCNSELEWISDQEAHETFGDLTEAPCLGIRDCVINDEERGLDYPLKERWRFMDYQVRSVLEELRDKGMVVFIS